MSERLGAPPRGSVSEWLALAATPTFALMALVAGLPGEGPLAALCAGESGAGLGGMAPMYLLMSLFHVSPWLGLLKASGSNPAARVGAQRSLPAYCASVTCSSQSTGEPSSFS